jgi:hypothetical protein
MAPAPVIGEVKVSVTGPFPEFPASEVQSKLSAAVNPDPFQLHGVAAHTTETTLFAPAKVTVPGTIPTVRGALKLAPSRVASGPNFDQLTKSFAPCADGLGTEISVSAQAGVVADKAKTIKPHRLQKQARLSIKTSLQS